MGSLLWFEVAGSSVALPVDQVLEIRAPGRTTAVPGAPSEVLGLIQHRGRMIPVIDLRPRLAGTSRDSSPEHAPGALIIIQNVEGSLRRSCALAVDRVSGVRDAAESGPRAGRILDVFGIFSAPASGADSTVVAAGEPL